MRNGTLIGSRANSIVSGRNCCVRAFGLVCITCLTARCVFDWVHDVGWPGFDAPSGACLLTDDKQQVAIMRSIGIISSPALSVSSRTRCYAQQPRLAHVDMRYLFLRAGRDVSVYYTACLASAGWGLSQCVNELLYIDTNLIRSSSSSSSPLLYNICLLYTSDAADE